MRKYVQIIVWSFVSLLAFYLLFLNHIEPTEVGIARNAVSGETVLQNKRGWNITAPWTRVSVIDTRPMRVGVYSAGRGFSTKLVQFNPQYYNEFVLTEGFRYYWWSNRFSFNWGYSEEHRGLKDILRGYAYSEKEYPFVVIVKEYETR